MAVDRLAVNLARYVGRHLVTSGQAAATCAIFGFFAMVWFGWAHEAPLARLRRPLAVGLALSVAAMVAGGVLTWRYWSDGTVFDERTGPRYGIIVAVEFAVRVAISAVTGVAAGTVLLGAAAYSAATIPAI